jgi:NADH-quinone oxidoreductase subunit N
MVRTQRGSEEIAAFRGLGKSNPRTAFLITVCFASLAGVPLTLGFMVKMYSFVAAITAIGKWAGICWLLPIMVLTAAMGFYYYFKVIRAMYWEKPQPGDQPLQVPVCTAVVLTACVIALIYLGTLPMFVQSWV